jgi:PAS domain S-box-containing protein
LKTKVESPGPKIAPLSALEHEDIFRLLVGSVIDYAIFVLDPKGRVATWNPGARRFKGYLAEEIIGKSFSVFYPQKDIDDGKPEFELKEATRLGRFEDEGWRVRKDGTMFWANVVITRLLNSKGELLGFGKITRDLTERRAADQRYRLLVDGVRDYAIYSLDVHGNVTSWNSGAQRLKGYPPHEIIGQHFSRFYTKEDAQAGLPEKVLATALREKHYESEGWRVKKDGTVFRCSVAVTPLFDDAGNHTGFSKVTRDITERANLMNQISEHAEELEVRIKESEATNAELEAFSYSVSHDLRAPIRAIEGFASALMEDQGEQLDDVGKDYVDEIQRAARRMNALVQDLLAYSRLGRLDLESIPVSLAKVAKLATRDLGKLESHVRVEIDPKLKVVAHEATLLQVFNNLLGNALKFQRSGVLPEVQVTSERRGKGVIRTTVRDNGIGIAPQHQNRVFKIFERLHSSETYPGTGVGLAIVQRSIARMGGKVGLESEAGVGSEFWFELPERTSNRH